MVRIQRRSRNVRNVAQFLRRAQSTIWGPRTKPLNTKNTSTAVTETISARADASAK